MDTPASGQGYLPPIPFADVGTRIGRVLECWSESPAVKIELRKEDPVMGPILAPPEFRFAAGQV
ncbi:hypothetical protein P3102_20655 [Amycolatopsis sp. QT-25]|uniref:hypothetical protein n=1 Tax=Amycolatopsis sp. QT-25 TaxID=3034022 RepID=UPI0023EB053B|nr:hypothetical protein [Amycolatopsis sp. QT-25]WET76537.1 hypothetical protein P3102_20655 [Amycolatopsis sp. QT-25]